MKNNSIWDVHWKNSKPIYLDDIIKSDPIYRLLQRLIFFNEENKKIIEVGCGSGLRTLALLKSNQSQNIEATLLDNSPKALKSAEKNASLNLINVHITEGNALDMHYDDETFDIVWNAGVNEHFDGKNRQKIFNEMSRILKVNGLMIVIVPNRLNLPYQMSKYLLNMRNSWTYGFEKPFSIFELKKKMSYADIKPIRSSGCQILGSLMTFNELLNSKNISNASNVSKDLYCNNAQISLKKYLLSFEVFLEEILGSLFGQNIGLVGIKRSK